jgi:hypothetical protein
MKREKQQDPVTPSWFMLKKKKVTPSWCDFGLGLRENSLHHAYFIPIPFERLEGHKWACMVYMLLGIFLYFLIHFAKLYSCFKFLQIWQPTVVRHSGRRAPRRFERQTPWPTTASGPPTVRCGQRGPRQPTAVGHSGTLLLTWGTAAATPI